MISISVTNLDGVFSQYRAAPELLNRAANAAVTAVTRKAEREMENRLAKTSDIPRKPIAIWRIKRVKRLPRGTGVVWAGYNPIKSAYVGKLKQEDWGASAGSYLFPGGFVAKMQSGHVGIFKREGPPRMMTRGRYAWKKKKQPIVEQRVNLPKTPDIADDVTGEVGLWFQDEFAKQLTRRVGQSRPDAFITRIGELIRQNRR